MGLPAVKKLKDAFEEVSAIWPFETGLQPSSAQLVFAEIYPSLLADRVKAGRRTSEILDAAQVRINAQAYHDLDRAGGLGPLFSATPHLNTKERHLIETEEAWILGAGHETALLASGQEKVAA